MRLGMGLGLGNLLSGQPITGLANKYSFNFDGSNDYLDLPITFSYTNHTISAWYYANSGDNYIFDTRDSSGDGIALGLLANGIIWYAVRGSGSNSVSSSSGSFNSWNHVAVTYNGSTAKIYLNGSEVGSGTFTDTISTTTNARIGALSYSTSGYFDGLIDEVAFWDTALSADDVVKIASKPVDFSKASTYATDRTSNLKLWLRAGDKVLPENDTAIARQDFYTDFDGTDDYVSVADDDDLSFGSGSSDSPFSISAWINPVDVTGFPIISKGIFNTSGEYLLWINLGNVLSFEIYDESVSSTYELAYYNSSLASYEGSWFHVCATYDGRGGTSANAGIKLYINGENVSTTLAGGGTYVAMENLGADTYIGRYDTYYADGKISNLAVYQTALDAQTISQMAKSRFTPMRDNRFSVVDFDGTNDYIDCGSDESLDNIWAGGGTLTAWIYPRSDGEGDFGMIAVKRNGNTSGWYLATNDESGGVCDIRLRSARDTADGGWATTSREITLNQWNHIAISYDSDSDSNNPLIYVNGISVGVTENDTPSGSHSSDASDVFKIGGDAGDFTYDGSISSLAVYNTIKSAEEIYAIYQQGITYDESSLSGLQGYWRMGDDTSKAYPTIADSSSNSNDGTITNGELADIVQQMVAGYDLGAFEGSEELGAEIALDGGFDTDVSAGGSSDNWTLSSTGVIHEISNGRYRYTDSATAIVRLRQGGSDKTLTLNKTHKLTFEIFDNGAYITFITSGETLIANTFYPVGTHSVYFTPTVSHTRFDMKPSSISASFSMDNFSLKEVLQSEVSDTYPAIIDVNEPVLGVEVISGSDWTPDSGITVSNGSLLFNTSTQFNKAIDTTAVSGKLYKTVFTISNYVSGSVKIRIGAFGEERSGNGTYTEYITSTTANVEFYAYTDGSNNFTIENISVKEVLGNVGTMTNFDNANSGDIMYGSVLPDQSFLTGVNSAYNFIDLDGSNEFITVQDDSSLTVSTALSASIWVNHDSAGAIQAYITNWDYPNAGRSYRIYYSSQIKIELSSAGASDTKNITASFTPVVGSWYHIAFTFDSGIVKIYINGESQTVTADAGMHTSLFSSNGVTLIGAVGNESTNTHYMNGKIGQTAIFNKVLSDNEISSIYTAGRHSNLLDSYTDNLIGYWAMSALDAKTGLSDVGDGTIYDRSGNSNHGTATNTESADLKSSPNAEPNGYAKGDTNRSTTTP